MKYINLCCLLAVLIIVGGCNSMKVTTLLQSTSSQLSTQTISTYMATNSIISPTTTTPSVSLINSSPAPAYETIMPITTPSSQIPSPISITEPILENCVTPDLSLSSGVINHGSLYLAWVEEQDHGVSSIDAKTQVPRLVISDVHDKDFFVSPYTGSIAWISNDNIFKFRKINGNEIHQQYDPSWGRFRQWLANDRIIFSPEPTSNQGWFPAIDNLYILTPDIGTVEHKEFEMLFNFAVGLGASSLPPGPVYDPSFKWAIYAMEKFDPLDEGVVLWDVQNEKEIWMQDGFDWTIALSGIDWRQDQNEVLISAPKEGSVYPPELFSLTSEGVKRQLTNLSASVSFDYMIFDSLWSPNGRYIAFVLNNVDLVQPLESRALYVLDTKRNIITNYCISPVNDLVWSPNSDQLAFIAHHNQLVVLNIESNTAQTIEGIATEVYGWTNWSLP